LRIDGTIPITYIPSSYRTQGVFQEYPMSVPQLDIPDRRISEFCLKWHITEMALFGSVLRDDWGADSDVDVLVAFGPDARIGLLELGAMEEELAVIFGRKVDLVSRTAVERSRNYIRRKNILGGAQVIYGAR
jgi:uncharacterized protein